MDGKPGMAEGWEQSEVIDPAIFRAGVIKYGGESDLRFNFSGKIVRREDDISIEDSSYNSIAVFGMVERLSASALIWFYRELYRICAHAAQVSIFGPYWSAVETSADLTNLRGLSEQMFTYLSAPSRLWMAEDPDEDGTYLKLLDGIDFDPVRFVRTTNHEWESRAKDAKEWALAHSLNICKRIEVGLVAHKPARTKK